jgi:hypothetical protein
MVRSNDDKEYRARNNEYCIGQKHLSMKSKRSLNRNGSENKSRAS